MAMFVGEDRHALVDDLVVAYGRVAAGEGPELVCLVAPIGWGKTRVVQEFYACLAANHQGDPAYWPSSIVEATDVTEPTKLRKRVHPGRFTVPGGAVPEWFWWALSCQRKADGQPAQAIEEAKEQLFVHAEGLEQGLTRAQRARQGLTNDQVRSKASALAGLLGVFVPPVGWAATVHDSVSQLYETGQGFFEARRRQARLEADRVVDAEQSDRSALVEELAGSLARLSTDPAPLPVVVVVDDAHDAAPSTVALIDRLLAYPRARVLMVATAWPDQLAIQAGEPDRSGTFGAWLTGVGAERATRIDLDRLGGLDLAQLVRAVAPATESSVVDGLVARADGNPFVLGLILTLPLVRRSVRDGAITLSPDQIAGVPTEIRRLYLEKWEDLPEPVREVLAVASVQGAEFVDDLARQSALRLGLDAAAEALPQALDPYAWVRQLDEALDAFVEPAQFDVTSTAAHEQFLTADDVDAIRTSLVDYIIAKRTDGSWADLTDDAQQRLLRHHVALYEEGFTSDREAAVASALELAEREATVHHYAESIRLGLCAIDWSSAQPDHPEILRIRSHVAAWLGVAGRVEEAVTLFQALLLDQVRVSGPESADAMITRSNVAFWLGEAGRLDEALAEYDVLLADQSSVVGATSPDTLTIRNNVASLLGNAGRLNEAVAQLQVLLADTGRVAGSDHPDTLTIRNNLATWLSRSGQVNEALAQLEALCADQLHVLGPDHPQRLATRNNVAFMLGEAGRLDEALAQFESLLADQRRVLGPDHPDTLTTRNNLAASLREAGRLDEALANFESLLADEQRVLGPDHPDTLTTRNNLAASLGEEGRMDEALAQLEVLLADQLRVLGPDHPDTLTTRSNIAFWLRQTGRVDDAIASSVGVLVDRRRVLGPDHPDTLKSRYTVASWVGESGRVDEALAQFELLLADQLRVLGPDHPDTSRTRNNVAFLLGRSERVDEAVAQFEVLLADRVRTLGPNHPDTLRARNNLAAWLGEADRVDEAVAQFEIAVADQLQIMGPDHPQTIMMSENLEYWRRRLDGDAR